MPMLLELVGKHTKEVTLFSTPPDRPKGFAYMYNSIPSQNSVFGSSSSRGKTTYVARFLVRKCETRLQPRCPRPPPPLPYLLGTCTTGVESMSLNAMGGGAGGLPPGIDPKFIQADRDGAAVLIPMGITSENVAAKFGISRAEQVGVPP